MTDPGMPENQPQPAPEKGLLDRHPKLGIVLIAGVFYIILIGMCLATAALIWLT
jgi:hypothetical protein